MIVAYDRCILFKYTSASVYCVTLYLLPKFMFNLDPPLNSAWDLHLLHSQWGGNSVYNFTSVTVVKLTFKCHETCLRFPTILLLPNVRKFVAFWLFRLSVGTMSLKGICFFSCIFIIHCRTVQRIYDYNLEQLVVKTQVISFQTWSPTVLHKFSSGGLVVLLPPVVCGGDGNWLCGTSIYWGQDSWLGHSQLGCFLRAYNKWNV